MDNYRTILQRAGAGLIGVGVVDMSYMTYRLSQGQGYSLGFNSLALVAGMFLLGGSLRAVPIITGFAAFRLSIFISTLFILMTRKSNQYK
ncbi:MAG: hypothetical protein HC825_10310 [Oscillatoriales cyanobacterium RM1_1_9]|nr:hypothetical protein [Oscillatoriales cyanobacterium SM2_3_0]NJO45154.1 hypothetical protein [Oscillatoriales cyanobacterium RM2_1_1]NJO71952.1 hypothetical protein [Oscillatoriales cyanobacterium RM1_1_9]